MLLPLKDENPIRITPVVTLLIIGLNLLGFFMELGAESELARRRLIQGLGVIPVRLTQDVGPLPDFYYPPWTTLFTSLFLHAGWVHLGGNMLYLWIFGNNIEDHLGHGRFLLFYLLSGLVATGSHVLLNPASPVPVIGASGAVAGVLGAYLVLFPRHRVVALVFFFYFIQVVRVPAVLILGFWFIIQVFRGTLSLGVGEASGVAWFAHVGGFLTGLLLIRLFQRARWSPLELR